MNTWRFIHFIHPISSHSLFPPTLSPFFPLSVPFSLNSLTHSSIYSLTQLLILSFCHLFAHWPLTHSLIHLFTHLFIHSLSSSFVHPRTPSLHSSLIRPLTHPSLSLAHSFTYSLTRSSPYSPLSLPLVHPLSRPLIQLLTPPPPSLTGRGPRTSARTRG